MSQEIPLYCDICMKYFSGPVSAQQHFESIDHQRKEASKQQAGQGGNSLFCTYCNKQCNSLRQFQEHNASPMHLAVIERTNRFNSPAPSPAPQETSLMDSEVSALGDHFLQLSMSEKANDLVGKMSYIFDGTRGYCNVCNLDLTSSAHARQHLNGEKHKKKERHFVQGTLGGTLSCALCQVSFSGPESAQQHLASDRHRKREAEAARGTPPTTPGLPAMLTSTAVSPAAAPALPAPPASWTVHPQTPTTPEQPRLQPEPVQEYYFDGNRGRCYVCEIELTSREHAKEHLSGKKHRKAAERKKAATQTASYPLYCQVCQVQMPDQAAAQSHYASDIHRQCESQSQQMRMFPARPQATPQESEDTEKKIRYYADPAASSGNQATHGMLYGGTGPSGYTGPTLQQSQDTPVVTATRPQATPQESEDTEKKIRYYADPAASSGNQATHGMLCGGMGPSGYTGPALQQPQDTPVVTATRPQATPQETEDTEKKVRYYEELAASTGMQRTPSGMAHETSGPSENPGLAKELPQDSRDITDGTSPSPATSAVPSSFTSRSGALGHQNANVDKTCVMRAHSPRSHQALVTERPSAVEMPKAAHLNHTVPLEFTQDGGFVCYACGGENIDNKEAIAQHFGSVYHEERMKSWISSKLAQPDEQPILSPLPAMDMKAPSPQTACNTPLPLAANTAVDPNPYIYTRTGNSTLGTPVNSTALTPCPPVGSPAGVGTFSCMICVERFSGPVPMEQHTSSERHRKKVIIWNHLQKLSPSEDGLVKPIYLDGDLTPWYPCDVCFLLMNTAEVLQKHKESPKHKEQVQKREQFMNSTGNSFSLVVSGNPLQERLLPGVSPLTVTPSSEPTEKPRVSPGQNSNDDYEKVWTALKEENSAAEPRVTVLTDREDAPGNSTSLSPPSDHSRTPDVDTGHSASTTAAATASSALLKSLISKQLKATKGSSATSFAEVIPTSQPPVAADPAHSASSFSHFRETNDSDDETLEFNENLNSKPPSSHSLSTQSGAAGKSLSKEESALIDPVVNIATPLPIQQRVASVTPGKQTSGGGGKPTDIPTSTPADTSIDAPGGAGGKKQRPYNPLKNRSKGGKHVGIGGGGDSSEEDNDLLTEIFDKKCSLEDPTQDSIVKFDMSLSSARSLNGVPPTSPTSQAGVAGSGASAGQGYKQKTLALTEPNKDGVDQLGMPPLPRPAVLPGTPLSSRPGAGLPAAQRPFPMFKYYCSDCNRPMNTKEAYDAHVKGQGHKQKVASKAAPPRDLGVTTKTQDAQQARQAAEGAIICMEPRSYQVELFCKAMSSDSIIFLPTGTGKTVIAAMVVSHMLHLNPTRPVLFLVDKVLLVLQQGQVITRELKNQQFLRQNLTDESKTENRELKIALLCGGLRGVDATPLYRHDIIVTTAAYCENMLADGIIHWEDFSLVVLDEAHHCVGKHPYCNIMRNRHVELPPERRPKVLGLTASPAGKNTLEDTITMLKNLMKSLGHARLSIVEGQQERQELDQFQSKTKITILTAEFTHEERQLCEQLKEYIVRCYFKLAEVCKIKDEVPIFHLQSMPSPETERIQACAKKIDDETLKTFIIGLQNVKPADKMEARALFDFLSQHAKFTIVTLQGIEGGAGVPFAVEEFRKLSSSDSEKEFDTAERYGLPAKNLMAFVNKLDKVLDLEKDMEEKGMHQVSLFGQLRHVLFSKEYIHWGQREQEERPMALVLVRERVVAIRLSEGLKQLEDVQALGLRVRHVVGHGAKAGDGMRVQQQKRVLDGMRGRRYHIVVATSVAEEGVDIPECELVITLNPPDSVTALVQMRGRARKQGSNFIVICEGKEKKQKLEQLLQREKNMAEAAKRCLHYNKNSST